jgi:hypothetical protein
MLATTMHLDREMVVATVFPSFPRKHLPASHPTNRQKPMWRVLRGEISLAKVPFKSFADLNGNSADA